MRASTRLASLFAAAWILVVPARAQAAGHPAAAIEKTGSGLVLAPTPHPPLPAEPGAFWIAPEPRATASPALERLAAGVALVRAGRHDAALTELALAKPLEPPAEDYRAYYMAVAALRLERAEAARQQFAALAARSQAGSLADAALLGQAEAASAAGDHAQALQLYERLIARTPMNADQVWFQLGEAARRAGNRARAVVAFQHVLEAHPLSRYAPQSLTSLSALEPPGPLSPGTTQHRTALSRAERLFEARRFEEARVVFERLHRYAGSADRDRLALRMAACDYSTRRYAAARAALRAHTGQGPHQAEARFYDLMAARGLGATGEFERLAAGLIERFGTSAWAQEALDTLASHRIRQGRDDEADVLLRRLLTAFPSGRFAERAAWKVGWRAFRSGNPGEAASVFEEAAARFPRSDYRPAFLYWSARAREALGDAQTAASRDALVRADYRHTYYGGLVEAAPGRPGGPVSPPATPSSLSATAPAQTPIPTAPLIRLLLSAGLYDDALTEIRFAQHRWGDSPALQATTGLALHLKGDLLAGARAVKRAWPQFLGPQGAALPPELAAVVYPVGYWSRIRDHAARHQLDPYLVAALIAQESGFVPDIRSSAKATGLMQLMPATAQRYAKKVGLTGYAPAQLERPEVNLRLGTAYFADLVREFGEVHLALASYNAGESRVRRWLAERPGLTRDVFVDDIPFPETREYVKKILNGAENYRRVYGNRAAVFAADPDRAIPGAASKRPGTAGPGPAPNTSAAARPPTKGAPGAVKKPSAAHPVPSSAGKRPAAGPATRRAGAAANTRPKPAQKSAAGSRPSSQADPHTAPR